MSLSPDDDELKAALTALRAQNTTLGSAKLHALLLTSNPTWIVSEKRARKALQAAGLVVAPPSAKTENGRIYPSSRVIDDLDVTKWSKKVAVKDFGKSKGKGLVATDQIADGETLWKEEIFIISPEWPIYDLQLASRACAHCTTPLTDSSLVTSCPSSTGPSSHCSARFCNRLCLSRSSTTHPLLCPSQNPASLPLLDFAKRMRWLALHALAQCSARVLLQNEISADARDKDWKVVRAFAELGMEERAKDDWGQGAVPDRETWKKAHKLFVHAFREPANIQDKKKLARLLKKPLPDDIAHELFDYDAFLRGLGRMSLNLEAHGGLYTLHAHLNHSCTPNISVRHLDQRTALSRITLLARRSIEPGEELTITYVDPSMDVRRRRAELMAWGFGICLCFRCVKDEKEEKEKGMVDGSGNGEGEGVEKNDEPRAELEDMERELKAGLGVM